MKKLLFTFVISALTQPVLAADWGCEVLLCLSNPAGPTAVSQCVPPITKLWDELKKGNPFPSCAMGSSSGSAGGAAASNYAGHRWANSGYCSPGLLRLDTSDPSDPGAASCNARGVVDVVVNGVMTTRVWWGVSRQPSTTLTETAAAGTASYDPTQTVSKAIAAYKAEQAAKYGSGG